ncbi:MAG: helix-turn-helix transcriptional regulator [Dehalococcoidia bacterium]
MPNIAAVLKDEIRRLARKEIREQVGPLKKTVHDQRGAIAELKRQNADLLRRLGFLEKREGKRLATPPPASKAADVRFSPKWVAADRKRLGFSAQDYARLVGVSPLTIYNWEKGKSKPQAKQLAAWADVRGIGKRQATRRLGLLPE